MKQFGWFACVLFLVLPASVEARSFRLNQVPHGAELGCGLCHASPRGGERNGFGFLVENTLVGENVDWAAVASIDSDLDGYPNGLELGDPDGTWVIGDPTPEGEFWSPSDDQQNPCGNGTLEGPEICDDSTPANVTCESLGYTGGILGCNDRCRPDESTCDGFSDDEPDVGFDMGRDEPDAGEVDMGASEDMGMSAPDDDFAGDEGCSTMPAGARGPGIALLLFCLGLFGRRALPVRRV